MEERKSLFSIRPTWLDGTTISMVLLACIIILVFVYVCTRSVKLRSKDGQTVIKWLVDFVRGTIIDNLPRKEVSNSHLMVFILFMFVPVSNTLSLVTKIAVGDDLSVWKNLTADSVVALTLTMMMIVLIYSSGMRRFDFKSHLVNGYLRPVGFLLLVELVGESMDLLTLDLCLYGNIFADEVLLGSIAGTVASVESWVIPLAIPLEMIWVVLSVFVRCIQVFIFVTLSIIHVSRKIETEE